VNKRKWMILFLVALSIPLTGCTYFMWSKYEVVSNQVNEVDVFTDKIVSSFSYSDLKISVASEQGATSRVPLPKKGIGFLGEKNVYFVTEGGNKLLTINELIKDIKITPYGDDNLRVNIQPSTIEGVNANFAQKLFFNVKSSTDNLSVLQKEKLMNSGFKLQDDYYLMSFEIKGMVIKRENVGDRFDKIKALSKSYDVQFYTTEPKKKLELENLLANTVLTPITLVGDIIMLPVYLIVMAK